MLPKLKGVNIFFEDWENWTEADIDREVADLKARGFNFVRTGVYFDRFYDFASRQIDPVAWTSYREKATYLMDALKARGIYVSIAPIESGELWNMQNQHWYTTPEYRDMLYWFFYNFARWCREQGWSNILYISVWWEPCYDDPWHDGHYLTRNGLLNYAEANADWQHFCAERGHPIINLIVGQVGGTVEWRPTLYYYIEWSRKTFAELTQWKVKAVKDGWSGMLVGGEIGFVGDPHTANEWLPSFYLGINYKPDNIKEDNLCAEPYVDVIGLHDYFDDPNRETPKYLAYPSSKPKVLEECGPDDYYVCSTDMPCYWENIRPKMEAFWNGANGFAPWAWKDYDSRHLGLKDINFNPRPVLQTMTEWLVTLPTPISPLGWILPIGLPIGVGLGFIYLWG